MATASKSPEEDKNNYPATGARPRRRDRKDSGFVESPKNARKKEQPSITSFHQPADQDFRNGDLPENSNIEESPTNARNNEEQSTVSSFHESTDEMYRNGNLPDDLRVAGEASTPNSNSAEMIAKINGVTSEMAKLMLEKTVNDLGVSHREKLQTPLDQSLGPLPNWYLLGLEVDKEDPEKIKRLEDLNACYCGGGNKGWVFLDLLEMHNSTLLCSDFAATAKKLGRDDIYQSFKPEFVDVALKDILKDTDKRLDLARLLNKSHRGWKFFAEKYKFSKEMQAKVDQAVKVPAVYSPTERLLDWFALDGVSLNKLEEACERKQFNNVVKIIQGIKQELCNVNGKV